MALNRESIVILESAGVGEHPVGVPAALSLEFLGGCSVSRAGVPISGLVSAKAQALVVYLALTGRPQPREALAGLLWGEQPEEDARASLRQVLTQLRRLIGDHVDVTRTAVAFNRNAPYRLDVEEFLHGVRDAPVEPDARNLRAALELYRGDLLTDFTVRGAPAFDEWLVSQREYVRQVALTALDTLADAYARRREYPAATEALSRLLALDPWREDAHRALMRVLAESGQRTAALARYAALRRILADELDAAPEPATDELAAAIRAGNVADLSARCGGPPSDQPARHNLPAQLSSFVGRTAELEELGRLWPTTRLLTLTGPGGCGKTRLALEFAGALIENASESTALLPDGGWLLEVAAVSDSRLVRILACAFWP